MLGQEPTVCSPRHRTQLTQQQPDTGPAENPRGAVRETQAAEPKRANALRPFLGAYEGKLFYNNIKIVISVFAVVLMVQKPGG